MNIHRILPIALIIGCSVLAHPAVAAVDERCSENDAAIEGWQVTDHRRGGSASYLILHKKEQRDRFYLCRLEGADSAFVAELGMEVNFATSRLEAARCTPVESGIPGNEYFSVIDNRTSQVLRVYRFDALQEDVETMSSDSVVCSALPAR